MIPAAGGWNAATTEVGPLRLALTPGLKWLPRRRGSAVEWQVQHPRTGRCYQLGTREYAFVSQLDGTVSVAAALTRLARQAGADALRLAEAESLCRWLLETELVASPTGTAPVPVDEATMLPRLLWWRIPLPLPTTVLRGVAQTFRSLPGGYGLLLSVVLLFTALVHLSRHWSLVTSASLRLLAPENWLVLGIVWCGLKLVHELSHAVVCLHHGGEPREWGVLFAMGMPSAYVDVSAATLFPKRWPRMHVAIAGMWAELSIAAIAALCFQPTNSPLINQWLIDVMVLASFTTIAWNANPLLRLDGYYLLADGLDIPNLGPRGQGYWRGVLQRWLFGIDAAPLHETGWRRTFIVAYGLFAGLYQFTLSLILAVTISLAFSGAGLLITAIFVLASLMPLVAFLRQEWRKDPAGWPIRMVRATTICSVGGLGLYAALTMLPWPGGVVYPGVVEFAGSHIVRASAPGHVTRLFVNDGDQVEAGQVLCELRNDELETELAELVAQRARAELEFQIHREQQQLGDAQAAAERVLSLEKQIALQQTRLNTLLIRAPRAGKVVSARLEQRLGTRLEEGEELLSVGDDGAKELQVAVPQRNLPTLRAWTSHSVRVMLPERPRIAGTVSHLDPHASHRPPHPALGANWGGPLAVRETRNSGTTENEFRLAEPHFRVTIQLPADTGKPLQTGQIAWVSFGNGDRTVLAALRQSWSDWYDQLKSASDIAARQPAS